METGICVSLFPSKLVYSSFQFFGITAQQSYFFLLKVVVVENALVFFEFSLKKQDKLLAAVFSFR